mmetsp:Transcript_18757/g.43590  ORF Transcript_18757/g.43590 Transcript_18757/m.43590 type:complete len:203 (+) Transcript_18757:461-1069(+)
MKERIGASLHHQVQPAPDKTALSFRSKLWIEGHLHSRGHVLQRCPDSNFNCLLLLPADGPRCVALDAHKLWITLLVSDYGLKWSSKGWHLEKDVSTAFWVEASAIALQLEIQTHCRKSWAQHPLREVVWWAPSHVSATMQIGCAHSASKSQRNSSSLQHQGDGAGCLGVNCELSRHQLIWCQDDLCGTNSIAREQAADDVTD